MKLNVRLILDSLNYPIDHIIGNPDKQMDIYDVYPFVPDHACTQGCILYVATWDKVRNVEVLPKYLICIGGGSAAKKLFEKHSAEGVVLHEESDVLLLQLEIQEIFTRYNTIERELLNALIENMPTHTILNACAMFLKCHVALYSADYSLLGYSDNFMPGENESMWQDTLKANKSVMTHFPRDKVHALPSKNNDLPKSTFLDIDNIPNHISIGFDYGYSRVATIVFCEIKKPISEHHQWLVDYIADILHPMIMERYNTFLDIRNFFRTSVSAALRYLTIDSTFLQNNLVRLGWEKNDYYQIVLVKLPAALQNVSHLLYNYEDVFAGSYSDCIALYHEIYILILLHGNACDQLTRHTATLRKQLVMDKGVCSIGMRFCDFTEIKMQYDLANIPFRISTKPRRINYYSDYMTTHLIYELSSCFPIRATCHHVAIRIEEYDIANGTNFLLTLETYLMNNKSLMAASEKLFIHRSTLTYRLKCIEKIVPMNLDDPCQRFHILLSCVALRILDKSENDLSPKSSGSHNDASKHA